MLLFIEIICDRVSYMKGPELLTPTVIPRSPEGENL